jgi:hemolysin activation/secretion protein
MLNFDVFSSLVSTGTPGTLFTSDEIRVMRGGLDGQLLDNWLDFLPAATTTANIRLHHAIRALGATDYRGIGVNASRNGSNFGFIKFTGEVQRNMPLFAPYDGAMLGLQGLFSGQYSNDVLPQAEKFFLGGARLGRGFYSGQATGDKGWGMAAELQLDTAFDLPTNPAIGNGRATAQFYLFRDISRAIQNAPGEPNNRLSSYGAGVRLVVSDAVQFDVEAYHRVTRQPDGAGTSPLKIFGGIFRTLVRF